MDFGDDCIDYLCETLYGDNFTKHDKQNVKRKYLPVIEGKSGFEIRNPDQASAFLVGCFSTYRDWTDSITTIANLKTQNKYWKTRKEDLKSFMDRSNILEGENKSLKEELDNYRNKEIQFYNNHPYCEKLLNRTDEAEKLLSEKQQEYNIKLQNLEEKKKEMLEQELQLHQEKEKLEEIFEGQKKGFIRRAKAENKDEEKMEMKMLKEQVKKLKKRVEKRDKSIIILQKEVAKEQQKNLKSLTDSDNSDSDSD